MIRLAEKINTEPDLEISLRQLQNQANVSSSLFNGGAGLEISMHDISSHKFHEYNSLFILAEDNGIDPPLTAVFPEGKLCLYF